MNKQISVPQVRLIDAEGENVGVVLVEDALERALDAGLDLVEISPNADPPVCEITDSGKLKYESQ
ncbi:MAG: translation initiation factor IF-3, partial [Rhodospirillales bacterium]|nr:translation initiation factor IF-3 [Rhodospirillales bacterium]